MDPKEKSEYHRRSAEYVIRGKLFRQIICSLCNSKNATITSRLLFTVLYYLYPANLLIFLRSPVKYHITSCSGIDCPYKESNSYQSGVSSIFFRTY